MQKNTIISLSINSVQPLYLVNETLNKYELNYDLNIDNQEILNLCGSFTVCESKYQFAKHLISTNQRIKVIVVNQDFLAFDNYRDTLKQFSDRGGKIIMFYDLSLLKKSGTMCPEGNAKRMKKAYDILKVQDINIDFYQSLYDVKKALESNLNYSCKFEVNKKTLKVSKNATKFFKDEEVKFVSQNVLRHYKPTMTLIKNDDVA